MIICSFSSLIDILIAIILKKRKIFSHSEAYSLVNDRDQQQSRSTYGNGLWRLLPDARVLNLSNAKVDRAAERSDLGEREKLTNTIGAIKSGSVNSCYQRKCTVVQLEQRGIEQSECVAYALANKANGVSIQLTT